MNRELIEDEGHRNPMTVAQLEERARRFLAQDGYRIDLFEENDRIVGFVTWRQEDDVTEKSGWCIHLRQFYVARDARGGGIGRRTVELLMSSRFPKGARVVLEVMQANPGGQAFWSRMGFAPYSMLVERRTETENNGEQT
jgi:GNAT superfamily N-acetyltransferase